MDTDLSNADASFLGEDGLDYSGYDLSGVGDINGDGYDDFLIGAYNDEDGGTYAGQSYLILGKSSGWSMGTDLGDADASFLGEDASDYAGYAVSGVGDINGDGYGDFIIGAWKDEEGGSDSGQSYLLISSVDTVKGDTAISDSSWYHVAGTFDGSNVKVYVNGVLESTEARTDNIVSTTSDLNIGISRDQVSNEFKGKIDEVRILNYAKTAFGGGVVIDEVEFTGFGYNYITLYNNAGSTADIRGWKLNNEDGNLITISSSITITAGGTLTLIESSYPNLANLDNSDYIQAYDLDPENNGGSITENYKSMVDFVAWGASPGAGDGDAVNAGLWTDNAFLSLGALEKGAKLSTHGNNDEALSDWEAIPEFPTLAVPVAALCGIVGLMRYRRRRHRRD